MLLNCSAKRAAILKIEKTWDLPFTLDAVFGAWVSSDTVVPPATRMEVNPVVGGHYRLIMETPEFTSINEGEFLVVIPKSRVKYTWEWDGNGEVTTIDVVFEPIDGGTRVRLLHEGFTNQDTVNSHDSGWESYVAGLAEYLR